MNPSLNLNLPEPLKPFREAIANTFKTYLKIKTIPNSIQWWQSKFGGFPYLPQEFNYPTNSKGEYLKFLAQINFTETPTLENFPTQGLLQFYIDGNDELCGLNFDNPTYQDNFRVIYFPDIEKNSNNLVTNFEFLSLNNSEFFPIVGEFSLEFISVTSPIIPNPL